MQRNVNGAAGQRFGDMAEQGKNFVPWSANTAALAEMTKQAEVKYTPWSPPGAAGAEASSEPLWLTKVDQPWLSTTD